MGCPGSVGRSALVRGARGACCSRAGRRQGCFACRHRSPHPIPYRSCRRRRRPSRRCWTGGWGQRGIVLLARCAAAVAELAGQCCRETPASLDLCQSPRAPSLRRASGSRSCTNARASCTSTTARSCRSWCGNAEPPAEAIACSVRCACWRSAGSICPRPQLARMPVAARC
jgi:hypothetical protein